MYCTKCGNEILPDVKCCLFCGAEVVSDEATAEGETAATTTEYIDDKAYESVAEPTVAAVETPDASTLPSKPPKRLRFKVLAITIPVIVLLLAAAVWATVSAGLFLSPKQYYMMVEAKNYIQKAGEIKSVFTDSITKYEALSNGRPNSFDTNLSMVIDEKDIPEESAKLLGLLNTLKIHCNVKTNPAELQAVEDISLSLRDNEMLNLNLYLDKTKLYADVPTLLDKYFFVDLQNIKAVAENFGLDATSLPERLTEEDIRKAIGLDNKQATVDRSAAILQKYGKLYYDSIPDNCVSLERGIPLELEGRNIKCGKVSIKFNQEQFKDFILAFTSALKDDEELYKLLYENMQESGKLMKNYNSFPGMGIDTTFDRDKFKEMIGSLEDLVKNDMKLPDGLSMMMWVNNGVIVKRTVETALGAKTEKVGVKLEMSGIKAADSKYRTQASLDISNKSSNSNGEKIGLAYKGSSWTDNSKINFWNGEVKLLTNMEGDNEYNFELKWDTQVKGDTSAKTISTKYDMKYSDGSSADKNFSLNGEFIDNVSENAKQKTFKDDIALSAYFMPAGENQGKKYGGKLQLVMERAYDIDFKLPAFDSGKIVDLGKVDETQLYEIGTEAGMSLVDLINKNPWLNDYTDFSSLTYMFGGVD